MGLVSNVAAPGYGLPLLPLWEKVSPKATDEGCSRESHRLTPLEHPSSVSALSRRSSFSHKGRRRRRAATFAIKKSVSP
ncbi:hypothetical protein SAMN03159463_03628 [Mesorhizobium sp. NFR06]|nr:hypothetical protein SAMN03159463_03628 [Mesorhizobium sp. NFR06]